MSRLSGFKLFIAELFNDTEQFNKILAENNIEISESNIFDSEFISDDCDLTDNEISQLINEKELIENGIV